MSELSEWPEKIRVRGFDFMHQGWNTVLHRESNPDKRNNPVYRMKEYNLYGLIAIIPIRICKSENGIWYLFSEANPYFPIMRKNGSQNDPFGEWVGTGLSCRVTRNTNWLNLQ